MTSTALPSALICDVVRVVRAVDRDRVGRAVARAAADRGLEVERDGLEVGPGRVVEDHAVGTAERLDVDDLDVVQVHRDVGGVAEEPDSLAVGRDVEVLGRAGPDEQERVGAVVGAVLPLDEVAAVARVPAERVVAGSEEAAVVAAVAVDRVVTLAAEQQLGAVAAVDRVVPGAAVDRDLDQGCEPDRAGDRVVAVEPFDVQEVVRRLRVLDLHGRGQPGHVDRTCVGRDRDRVVAGGAVDGDRVGRAVAGSAADRRLEVELDVLDVGRGQVVHDRVVDAAERADIDPLGVVDVHGDVRDVAEELQAVAVGGEVEALRDSGAVEDQRVGAGFAFHLVAAVAGIPRERVVAGAEETGVVSAVAVDRVVLVPPRSVSLPSPPLIASLPAPPSSVSWVSAASPSAPFSVSLPARLSIASASAVDDVDRQAARAAGDGDAPCDRRGRRRRSCRFRPCPRR